MKSMLSALAATIFVIAAAGSAHAEASAAANLAFDEVTPAYGVSVTGPRDFEGRYARITRAMSSGEYISEEALSSRLQHLSEERMRESQAANKGGLFGMLLSILPGPAGQIGNALINHRPGALLGMLAHAIPGAGGIAASELLSLLPHAAGGNSAMESRDLAHRLQQAAQFERTVGTLKHYSFYNGMERIDDVAGETAQIVRPQDNKVIELDLHEKRYTTRALNDDTLMKIAAASAAGTYAESGTERVSALQHEEIAGMHADGYTIDRDVQIQATGGCGRDTASHIVTTVYYSAFLNPQRPASYLDLISAKCEKNNRVAHAGPSIPARLPLFQRIVFPGKNVELVTERGNIHTLGPADAALFEVPGGFKSW